MREYAGISLRRVVESSDPITRRLGPRRCFGRRRGTVGRPAGTAATRAGYSPRARSSTVTCRRRLPSVCDPIDAGVRAEDDDARLVPVFAARPADIGERLDRVRCRRRSFSDAVCEEPSCLESADQNGLSSAAVPGNARPASLSSGLTQSTGPVDDRSVYDQPAVRRQPRPGRAVVRRTDVTELREAPRQAPGVERQHCRGAPRRHRKDTTARIPPYRSLSRRGRSSAPWHGRPSDGAGGPEHSGERVLEFAGGGDISPQDRHASRARRSARSMSGNRAADRAAASAARVCAARTSAARPLDRQAAGEEIEQQHAEAVDIARWRMPGCPRTARAPCRAACPTDLGVLPGVERPRAAEVHQDDAPADLAHDVVRLDVAVQQAGGVERRQRAAQIDADAGHFARAHRPALADHRGERLALDELHPDADLLRRPRSAP